MRLFVAVNFDDSVRAAIHRAIDTFPVEHLPWRWTAPQTWHVTLKFIGETSRDDLAAIERALDDVRARHAPFDVRLGAFGGFPSLRAPRVLFYAADEGDEALTRLAADVDSTLHQALGLARESRRFHAHATVARVKDRLAGGVADALARVPPLTHPAVRVAAFDLMESRLAPRGATYSVVHRFSFA
jgi:RNA 2',3'-cyclic 3'-phosphodiesterase